VVEWNGKPVLSIRKAFGRVRDDAGLGEDVTPHILRHSAITWAMQAGADPWEVAGYFGATREVIERVYGHQHPDHQGTVHRSMTGRRA
jgi:integrase